MCSSFGAPFVIPHKPMLRFVMRVDPQRERRNGKSRCVCTCGTHEKTLTQSRCHPLARTSRFFIIQNSGKTALSCYNVGEQSEPANWLTAVRVMFTRCHF